MSKYKIIPLLLFIYIPCFVLATNYYVSNSGNDANDGLTPATATLTINQAIALSSNGDVINIAAGTYTEQVFDNGKSIELTGAGEGNTIIDCPSSLTQFFVRNGTNQYAVVLVTNASNVKINDLTVNGLGLAAETGGGGFNGIAYNNSSGIIDSVESENNSDLPAGALQRGNGIIVYANAGTPQTIVVNDNNIHDNQKTGIVLDGANLTATADSNTVTGSGPINFIAQNGIQVSNGAVGTVANNTISNFNYTPTSNVAVGILFFAAGNGGVITSNNISNSNLGIYEDDAVTITDNTISSPANGVGIYITPTSTQTVTVLNNLITGGANSMNVDPSAGAIEAEIHFNSLTGASSFTIANQSASATVNATCNWYGTTDAVVIATEISGSVTHTPYLIDGTNTGNASMGFQPTPGSCTVLTLTLIDFSAVKNNNVALLSWVTANEINTENFIAERSTNGNAYSTIGTANAAGNSSITQDYSFTDNNPAPGTNYYRLKMVDKEGSFAYSPIRILNFDGANTIVIYPNPVEDVLTITGVEPGMQLRLIAVDGRILSIQLAKGNTEIMHVQQLAFGIYFIQVIKNGAIVNAVEFNKN